MPRQRSRQVNPAKTSVESAVWRQAIAVLAVVAIAAAWAAHAHRQPMDAGELAVAVSQLASNAAEGRTLLEQRRSHELTRTFFIQHARQLQEKVQAQHETLRDRRADAEIDGARRSAAQAAATLTALLGVLIDPQREAVNADELERLARQLDTLQRGLQQRGS